MISAEVKRLHSPDVFDLVGYTPADSERFGFLLQIIAGPAGNEGEESFDVIVCTPKWFDEQCSSTSIVLGRHHLFVQHYDYSALKTFIVDYCARCTGGSWSEVAQQLGRLGMWEFEDYRQ
jgi:hypothetical protein